MKFAKTSNNKFRSQSIGETKSGFRTYTLAKTEYNSCSKQFNNPQIKIKFP